MPIAQLSIDLVAKMATFERDLKRTTALTQQQTSMMAGAMNSVKSSIVGLAGAFTVGFLVDFVKRSIDSVDALNDIKDATGASIENISALEDIAARTGTTMDTVTTALVKFNGVLKDVKPGSDSEKAFKALNLDIEELKRLDPAEALLKTATAFSTFADDGNKARIMQELFGKSLKDVAPFLKDLAEKGELVAKVTTQQALEAEKFNKQIFEMQKNFHDLSREIAGPLVSAFNAYIEKQNEAKKAGKFGLFTSPIQAELAYNASRATGSWGDAVGNAGRGNVNPELVKPSIADIGGGGKTGGGSSGSKKDPYAEAARYIESLQKQIEKTQELTALQQLGMDINAGRLGKMTAAQQAEAIALAQKIDSIKEELDLQKQLAEVLRQTSAEQEEFFQTVMAADDAKQSRINVLLGATATGRNSATQADLVLLQTELDNGRISAELYAEAVIELFDLAGKETNATISLAEDLGLTFSSAFEDAIVGGGKLSDVLAGLEQDIMRIVTRRLVTEPMDKAITGMLSSAMGGGLDNFDPFSLISFDGGGSTGGNSRSGGLDGKGGFVAMLHPQETVIDHTKDQRTGNTVNVTVNQTFAAGTSRATTLQAAADARKQLEYAGRNL